MVTSLKLSEAIRLGAAKSLPTTGLYSKVNEDGQICTCALGAAYLGAFGEPPEPMGIGMWTALKEATGLDIDNHIVDHPAYNVSDWNLSSAIISLNDSNGWSREKIADWLERIGL